MKKLIAVLLLLSSQAFADVLFFDLNGNEAEVEAARRGAAKRGEKLIVLPEVEPSVKSRLKEMQKQFQKFQAAYSAKCMNIASGDCEEMSKKGMKIEAELGAFLGKIPRINRDNLKDQLAKFQGKNISALVISGHDGNGNFSGDFGGFSDQGLKAVFDQVKPLGDNIRSLYLWGCYTSTIGSVDFHWKKAFPNVEMIAGFDGRAPLGDKKGSSSYLEDALVKEKQLTQQKDAKSLQKVFKSLKDVNAMYSSVCVGDNIVNNKRAISISQAKELCAKLKTSPEKASFQCYKKAEKGCENPPQNTSQSPLRTYYNFLQDHKHCREIPNSEFDSPDTVISLIFFDQVKKNFARLKKDELKDMDQVMKTLGIPDDLSLSNIEKLNRAEIIEKIEKLRSFLGSRFGSGREENPLTPEVAAMTSALNTMDFQLLQLMVPFSWVEPNASEQGTTLGVSSETILFNRKQFEGQRAYAKVQSKMGQLIGSDPELRALNEELFKAQKQAEAAQNRSEGEKKTAYDQYVVTMEKRNKAYAEFKEKNRDKLKEYVQTLKSEDYPHPEGKKAFQEALDGIVQINFESMWLR